MPTRKEASLFEKGTLFSFYNCNQIGLRCKRLYFFPSKSGLLLKHIMECDEIVYIGRYAIKNRFLTLKYILWYRLVLSMLWSFLSIGYLYNVVLSRTESSSLNKWQQGSFKDCRLWICKVNDHIDLPTYKVSLKYTSILLVLVLGPMLGSLNLATWCNIVSNSFGCWYNNLRPPIFFGILYYVLI